MKEVEKRKFIKNLWFLLLYASEYFDYIEEKRGSKTEGNFDNLADLIAEILLESVKLRLKRNLNLNYVPRQEVLRRVRGRIDLLKTERNQLLQKGQVACRFEELTIDTPRNRFVRDALEKIARSVNRDLANKCRLQALSLRRAGVKGIAPSCKEMQNQRYGRNDKNDKEMIFASILAFQLSMPDESAGFSDLLSPNYKGKLHDLYEDAITNFYRKTLRSRGWKIKGQTPMSWEVTERSERARDLLPRMKTDMILDNKDGSKNIIVDTKFREIIKKDARYGKKKISSDVIYQIYTYLGSQQGREGSPVKNNAEGLLLYPCVGEEVDETFELQQFNVRFATVDFLGDERSIRKRLIEIIEQ